MRPQLGKEKILNAAWERFASRGFHATSISEIARAANVSKGLMYNYFRSKEDLLLAIVDHASQKMHQVAQSLSSSTDASTETCFRSRLRNFLDHLAKFLRSNKDFLSFQLSLLFQPDLKSIVQAPLRKRAKLLLAHTSKMFAEAGMGPDAELIARRFISELDGIALHYLSLFPRYPLDDMLEQVFQHYESLAK